MKDVTFPRLHRALFATTAAALLVLTGSGAWLTWYYQPWSSFGGLRRRPGGVSVAVGLHRGAAVALLVALGLLTGIRLVTAAWRAVWPALAVAAGVALVVTGRELAWTQVGLWAVTVDLDGRGMLFAALDDLVRFVLSGGREMSQGEFRTLLGVHVLTLPVAVAALLVVGQRVRDRPSAPGT